jgi:hypothetical protein
VRESPVSCRAAGWLCFGLAAAQCGGGRIAVGPADGASRASPGGGVQFEGGGADIGDGGANGGGLVFPDATTGDGNVTISGNMPPCPACGCSPDGPVSSSDCPGCAFPSANAALCPTNTPAITLVYPPDNVLVPPNLNVLSVQWTPYGAGFQRFSVDFTGAPCTDWHILTTCQNQTIDAQSGAPSSGCELTIDPVSWSKLVGLNRGGDPVTITVRGTVDGRCIMPSTNSVRVSFAEKDVVGSYYYWKSSTTPQGVGGQIWSKIFGDLNQSETDMTSGATPLGACSGCHALPSDGSRMIVSTDDGDSDDEYGDLMGSFLDSTIYSTFFDATVASPGSSFNARATGQPPGVSAFHPAQLYYLTSNGLPWTTAGNPDGSSTTTGYPSLVPSNAFSVWNGLTGAFIGAVPAGPSAVRPTMPHWSSNATSVVYVQPAAIASWDADGGSSRPTRSDDDHVFGGSLYAMPYLGSGSFGAPSLLLPSTGENNYYPTYSPDGTSSAPPSFVLFDRVRSDVGAGTSCSNGICPNDSFSNPNARLTLMPNAAGAPPIDLETANGSPLAATVPLSNSYPRWAPFVQTYRGKKLLWFTFSSTRDYGIRVLNHKPGMRPCYPADAYETPGGARGNAFAADCQQPQLWMASVDVSAAQSSVDPSSVAFWIPYQDIATHNHTAQWTQQSTPVIQTPNGIPPCVCSQRGGPCGPNNNGCGCCVNEGLSCTGQGTCDILGP